MKKKLNLVSSNMKSLQKNQLRNILGGGDHVCGCGCCGPSSAAENGIANSVAGKNSKSYCFEAQR